MSQAGPISTITIAVSSLNGVLFGGVLSDKWVQKNRLVAHEMRHELQLVVIVLAE